VLFAWATNDLLFKDMTNANNRQALYSSQIKQIEEEMTPFGFIVDGQNQEDAFVVEGGDLWLSDKYQGDLARFMKEGAF
jgi:hypothetical protein